MGIVVQFPTGGARESQRIIRALERVIRECLMAGPQLFEKVRLATNYISEDIDLFDEARFNLEIRKVEDPINDLWYLAMPGDETRVPNATQYEVLERREG